MTEAVVPEIIEQALICEPRFIRDWNGEKCPIEPMPVEPGDDPFMFRGICGKHTQSTEVWTVSHKEVLDSGTRTWIYLAQCHVCWTIYYAIRSTQRPLNH